jgi:putative nucleotidyltransferase with HDIG domain
VRDREQHAKDTEELHLRTIEGLAMAIEAKDKGTHRHLMRVRVYVAELGKLMGLDEPVMQALLIASFLHDIGKLAVPEYIINKPGKLTPQEFEKMKIHPVVGADILKRVRFPYPVVPIVRSHHEAWDGSGYPDGLKGEEIPIGARLLTAVDCFDALASERPYRKAMPLNEAMAFVKARAGTQFDAQIVDLLDKHYLELEEKARRQIEGMEPLKTDLIIHRGAAPGAGFETEHDGRGAVDRAQESAIGPGQISPQRETPGQIAQEYKEADLDFELSRVLSIPLSTRETFAAISRCLRPLIPFDCFAMYLKSDETLSPRFIDGAASTAFSLGAMPIGTGLTGWVGEHARPIVNGNPTMEPNYLSETGLLTADSSALSVPLFELSGAVFGVITVYSARSAAFSKDHLRILQLVESRFSPAMQSALRFDIAEADANIPTALKSLVAR